jgi:hypothetical protein
MTNFLDATAGSTHATDNAVKLYMPPEHAARVLAYLDQLPNPAKARQARTDSIEALVLLAMGSAKLRADLEGVNRAFWVTKLITHLNAVVDNKARYTEEFMSLYGVKRPRTPSRAKIRDVLVKHGFML